MREFDFVERVQAVLIGAALAESQLSSGSVPLSETGCAHVMMSLVEGVLALQSHTASLEIARVVADCCARWSSLTSGQPSSPCVRLYAASGIGCLYYDRLQNIRIVMEAAGHELGCTNATVAAWTASAGLVALGMSGCAVHEYPRQLMELVDGMSDVFDSAIYRVGHVGAWTDTRGALAHIGLQGHPEAAVAHALYWLLRHPDDYHLCVQHVIEGSAQMLGAACIVGGTLGARLGLRSLLDHGTLGEAFVIKCHELAQRLASVKQGVKTDDI